MHHLIKMLSLHLGPHKIRANALAPGCKLPLHSWTPFRLRKLQVFPSEISAPLLDGKDGTKEGSFPSSFIPAERTGDEQDISGTILYLASRAGAYLNGNILVIDGGRMSVLNSAY